MLDLNYNVYMKTYLFIVNGLGIGDLPDCTNYNSKGHNTLVDILGGVPLPSLKMLGLYNIFGASDSDNSDDTDVVATYARGRMLTNRIGLEHGVVEMLGHIFHYEDDSVHSVEEDVVARLANSGVTTYTVGGGKNFQTDYLSSTDIQAMEHISNSDNAMQAYVAKSDDDMMDYIASVSDEDALVIAEFSDFERSVMDGDNAGAISAMINFDSWVGVVMDAMDDDDLLIVSGNHGISMRDKCLTREYVPIMMFMRKCPIACDLGTKQGLNVIAYTIADIMGVYKSEKAMMSPLIVSSRTVEVSLAKIRNIVTTGLEERKKNVKATIEKVKCGIHALNTGKDNNKGNKKIATKRTKTKTLAPIE